MSAFEASVAVGDKLVILLPVAVDEREGVNGGTATVPEERLEPLRLRATVEEAGDAAFDVRVHPRDVPMR
jgi:hypothetical protein